MELMALTDADILVITLVTQTARPAHRHQTPEAVAVQPVTDVIRRSVTILINLVVLLIVMKADAIAILVLMVAVVPENAVVRVPLRLRLKLPEVYVVVLRSVVLAALHIRMILYVNLIMAAVLVILIVCQLWEKHAVTELLIVGALVVL